MPKHDRMRDEYLSPVSEVEVSKYFDLSLDLFLPVAWKNTAVLCTIAVAFSLKETTVHFLFEKSIHGSDSP